MDFILWIFCILNFVNIVRGRCYFPGELQGIWATQAAPDVTDAPIAYSMVTIDADHVSTWGQCHSKINDDIILAANRSGPHSAQCFRCFRLVVASVNVAALVSGGLETCFASVDEALLSCPTTERGAAHLVLYKVGQSRGVAAVQETQCPFSGIYFFSYEKGTKGHRGSGNPRCEQPTSEMSNCPFGFSLSLQYRDCTFDNPRAANWHCLGSWEGLNGQKYTTFLDMDTREGDGKPKYKCGIYRQDKNGRVFLSFSRDSTCVNDLVDAENGHERYVLYTAAVSPLPNTVRDRPCRFPSSLRGEWHNTLVETSSIAFKNEQSFNTLHMQCTKDMGDSEKYVVYTRTDCGKWYYNCIMIKRRSANIIEFKLGERQRETLHPDLCDSREFNNLSPWITRAKTRIEDPTVCPIVGSYKGDLPDSPGYCAELYSDCSRKDHMYYAIDECSNPKAVYEQREYQCLGQWEEEGNIYALTRRKDIHTYECFVGRITDKGFVFMKETGSSCRRGVRPDDFGMKTVMKSECPVVEPEKNYHLNDIAVSDEGWRESQWRSRSRAAPPTKPPWVPSTRRTWDPIALITGRPNKRRNAAGGPSSATSLITFSVVLVRLFSLLRL